MFENNNDGNAEQKATTYFVIHPMYVNVLDANHRVQSSHDPVPSIPFHKFYAPMTFLILCKLPLSKISSPYCIQMFVKLKRQA